MFATSPVHAQQCGEVGRPWPPICTYSDVWQCFASAPANVLICKPCSLQGLNQGLNLRDSGCDVSFALRKEAIETKRASFVKASENGFKVDQPVNEMRERQYFSVFVSLCVCVCVCVCVVSLSFSLNGFKVDWLVNEIKQRYDV